MHPSLYLDRLGDRSERHLGSHPNPGRMGGDPFPSGPRPSGLALRARGSSHCFRARSRWTAASPLRPGLAPLAGSGRRASPQGPGGPLGSLPCWREPLSPPPRRASGGTKPNGLTLLGLCHRDLGGLSQRPPTGTPSSGLATPSHHRRSARCQKSEHPHVKNMNTPSWTQPPKLSMIGLRKLLPKPAIRRKQYMNNRKRGMLRWLLLGALGSLALTQAQTSDPPSPSKPVAHAPVAHARSRPKSPSQAPPSGEGPP
ncbi:hypothetical protein SAMN02746019_00004280 [Thermoflexus hugenholtzii JAD2]|uniref:Uncharacterized protein n=1 Tax=Thermoflexus hugenholtzii JAD2 TaxID=877466 RepID=A0A212QQP6_9CHLR|nr:hypothetical protein SAMN02746019_00004280 [Thermoflexus hugenholtzii JAD2]